MQVAIERRPGSKAALTIRVEPAVLEQQREQLFQKYARRAKVPGFRPGKAPRRILEERIDKSLLQQEAVEAVIDTTYKQALSEQQLEPLERGEIDDIKVADDLSLTYTVLVSIRPEVKLGDYLGLEVTKSVTEVTDAQVDGEIEQLRTRTADYQEITDDGIQHGDYVTIDYSMTVDGAPYPEGDTTGYPLEVGTDTFFPELNEGLLGIKEGGMTKAVTHYAENYSKKDLAGKTAEFDITVQQVRRMVKPDASDEWAQLISQGALSSLEELRARVKSNLQAIAARSDREQLRNQLVSQVVVGAELDIPDTLADDEFEHLMHDFEDHLREQRMTLEEYAKATDQTVEDIRSEQMVMARDMVRRSLVLQEVAQREKLLVNEEDINEMLGVLTPEGESVATFRKEVEKSGRMNSLVSRLFHEKVLSFLENHAKIELAGGTETAETTAAQNNAAESATVAAPDSPDTQPAE